MARLKDQPKIGIITQARMTSTRLPGKVMLIAGGKTLLDHHIERLQKTGYEVAIATTVNTEDDIIEDFARSRAIPFFRGSEHDVLGRFHGLNAQCAYDIMVRVTSDCPLIDGSLITEGIEKYLASDDDYTYVSNCFPRSYARGFDFEIFSRTMLEEAFSLTNDPVDREHVTPFFWKNKTGNYRQINISQKVNHGDMRITVDTEDDFKLMQLLIEKYHADSLNYLQIEMLLEQHPELVAINAHIEQKKN